MDHKAFFSLFKSKDIKNKYLFCGSEEFVKRSAITALTAIIDEDMRSMNVTMLDSYNKSDFIAQCETLPFFAEHRIIILSKLPDKDDAKAIIEYLDNVPDTTIVVFNIRGNVDSKLSIVKYFAKLDLVVNFDMLDEVDAVKWVFSHAKDYSVTITKENAAFLISLVGRDLSTVNGELAKTASFVGEGNEIDRNAISKCVIKNIEYKIFDMQDYLFSGKAGDGIRVLYSMLDDGEPAMKIASFLVGRLKLTIEARKYIDKGMSKDSAVKLMGNNFPAKKAYDHAKLFDMNTLLDACKAFSEIGYLQISGRMSDKDALIGAVLKYFVK